jgi:hypothetical protein
MLFPYKISSDKVHLSPLYDIFCIIISFLEILLYIRTTSFDDIIDKKDNQGLTPLYLLCENGFRKSKYLSEEEKYFN